MSRHRLFERTARSTRRLRRCGRYPNQVDRTVPAGLEVHLVLDNYATHKTAKVAAWFRKRPHYRLHFTPTSVSWLNQVERWFGKITEQRVRRGVFKSVDELIAAIDDYFEDNNKDPKSFVWTATAELILDRVNSVCNRTDRSPQQYSVAQSKDRYFKRSKHATPWDGNGF